MLRIDSKNLNFNGTSVIDELSLASFSASINEPDNVGYISVNFNNLNEVRQNLNVITTDLDAFLEEILKTTTSEEDLEEEEE